MDAATLQFIVYLAFGLATLAFGITARKAGWIPESFAKPIHFYTVSFVWSTVALLSIWRMQIDASVAWLLVIVPLNVAVPALFAAWVGRWWFKGDRNSIGVMVIASGVSNTGATLGAFLCYQFIEPAAEARGVAIAYVTIMATMGVLMLYPVAQRFASEQGTQKPLGRLIRDSFFCLPAASMYTAITGVILSLTNVPLWSGIDRYHIVDALFYLATLGGYLGIGLRLRLGNPLAYLRHHLFLVMIKFAFIPILAWALVGVIALIGQPLNRVASQTILLESFMPMAVFSVMTANLFGLDARLASIAWLWNTLLFVVLPLPFLIWWMSG